MNKNLTIIGNGFDLHHGLKSSYANFGQYVKINDIELYNDIERYFNFQENWSDFESSLADIDAETIIEEASSFLVGYGSEEWKDSANHDYQYEIEKIVTRFTKDLPSIFQQWIQSVDKMGFGKGIKKLNINLDSVFLNFNYTSTLERFYGIPNERINHIHGSINGKGQIILGHAYPGVYDEAIEGDDFRVQEGKGLINAYFRSTRKPTEKIITDNQCYFNDLAETENIYVIGHSMSTVDHGYFLTINKIAKNAVWNVYIYDKKNEMEFINKLNSVGVNNYQIKEIKEISI